MPLSMAARMIEVPAGTVTVLPSMVSVTIFSASELGRSEIDLVDERHVILTPQLAAVAQCDGNRRGNA